MKYVILVLLAVAGGAELHAQSYHDAAYLTGGYRSVGGTEPGLRGGLWLIRGDGTATTVALPSYDHSGFCMDVDNRQVVVACRGRASFPFTPPMWGIYRFDPTTMQFTTIYGPDTVLCNTVHKVLVDQDGDYVFNVTSKYAVGTTFRYDPQVFKVTSGGTLTTLLTTIQLGRDASPTGAMCRDIDTGKILLHDQYLGTIGPAQLQYPVIELAPRGRVATWSAAGGRFGLWRKDEMPQHHLSGALMGIWQSRVFQTSRGGGPSGQIASIGVNLLSNCFQFDLQTAHRLRWVGAPYMGAMGQNMQYVAYVDSQTYAVTSLHVSALGTTRLYASDFEFYRGRHIQTVKTGVGRRWDIRLSCPRSPRAPYALAAGLTGVRPGIQLPDGRRINLNPDRLTAATLRNLLPGVWNPGPGVLGASGEALGTLDLSGLKLPSGDLQLPIWIALVVLDSKSPLGIKYLPDTYVMRL